MKINLDFIYPVGSIYETTSTVHPNILFGGTWELYGAGRVTVCRDESQSEFADIGQTGGEKEHKLTINEMPKHSHSILFRDSTNGSDSFVQAQSGANLYGYNDKIGTTGGDQPHNNMPPYIVVYRYRRIA